MPRKFVPITTAYPYHITARSHNKSEFPADLEIVWSITQNYLRLLDSGFEVFTHAFVLMPNHFHWIVRFNQANHSEALNYFMRETSRAISRSCGRINQIWGGRNYKCLINNSHYYLHAYKYVYSNPIRAGLVSRAEDYPYSTLSGLVGTSQLVATIREDNLIMDPSQRESTLKWINTFTSVKNVAAVREALRKGEFNLPRDRKTRSEHPLTKMMF